MNISRDIFFELGLVVSGRFCCTSCEHQLKKTMMTQLKKSILLLFAAGFIAASCDGIVMSDDFEQNAKVSLSTTVATNNSTSPKAINAEGLTIDSARILVRSVKLHHINDADSMDFKSDSFVLTLDPDNPAREVALSQIPFGVYNKFSFRIHKPEDGETPPDPDFMESASGKDRYSVILNGSYNGEPFEFKFRKSFRQKVDLNPDLVIDEASPASINVTLEVDLNSWFTDDDGNFINPTSEDAEEEIEDAIKRSFRMFKDNDHDGENDDDKDGREDEDGDDADDENEDEGNDGSEDDNENDGSEVEIEVDLINTGADSTASGYAEYEEEGERREFKVEVEDLDPGTYELYLDRDLITRFDVIDTGFGVEGEVEFRTPAEEGKMELSFDPRGKTIEVAQDSTVYMTVDFPE